MDRNSRTSRSASVEESNEELNLWKRICASLVKLESIQKETQTVLEHINQIHVDVDFSQGISSALSQSLKNHYQNGIQLSSSEAKIINSIIEKMTVLIALREASENNQEQRRKKRKTESDESKPSHGSNTSPSKKSNSEIIPSGTTVAARQPKQKDKNEEWILAVVIRYYADKNRYQVEDVDQDEFGEKQRYMLSPRNVIPVRDTSELKQKQELAAGHDVLALYPGTTCFYKAVVVQPPSKNKDTSAAGNYRVRFEDDNDQIRSVQPGYVLEIPKSK